MSDHEVLDDDVSPEDIQLEADLTAADLIIAYGPRATRPTPLSVRNYHWLRGPSLPTRNGYRAAQPILL